MGSAWHHRQLLVPPPLLCSAPEHRGGAVTPQTFRPPSLPSPPPQTNKHTIKQKYRQPTTQVMSVLNTHFDGTPEYDSHQLYSLAQTKVTAAAVRKIRGKRPFILSRYAVGRGAVHAGSWSGHPQSPACSMQPHPWLPEWGPWPPPVTGTPPCAVHPQTRRTAACAGRPSWAWAHMRPTGRVTTRRPGTSCTAPFPAS